jgi:hypothetical protein
VAASADSAGAKALIAVSIVFQGTYACLTGWFPTDYAKMSAKSKQLRNHGLILIFFLYRLLCGLTRAINTCFWLHKYLLRKNLR